MDKKERYQTLLAQVESVITKDEKWVTNCSNFCALVNDEFNYHWVGFYFVSDNQRELYLGPYQGPLACTRIPYGKGVCGKSWSENKTFVVPNVHEFEGHIACSSLSQSEIVIPLRKNNEVIGVLDIDSAELNEFSQVDREHLEKVVTHLMTTF